MGKATFRILKQCLMCGNMFEAQRISTAYCSHKCNSKHYKLKKRLENKDNAEAQLTQQEIFKPKISAINKAMAKGKEFLTVNDIAVLFGCTTKTVYSLINSGKIPATKLSKRKTIIKRTNIDKLFE